MIENPRFADNSARLAHPDEAEKPVREFIAREITPYHGQWEKDGAVSRDAWRAAGRAGLLGIHINMPGTVPPSVLNLIQLRRPAPAGQR